MLTRTRLSRPSTSSCILSLLRNNEQLHWNIVGAGCWLLAAAILWYVFRSLRFSRQKLLDWLAAVGISHPFVVAQGQYLTVYDDSNETRCIPHLALDCYRRLPPARMIDRRPSHALPDIVQLSYERTKVFLTRSTCARHDHLIFLLYLIGYTAPRIIQTAASGGRIPMSLSSFSRHKLWHQHERIHITRELN